SVHRRGTGPGMVRRRQAGMDARGMALSRRRHRPAQPSDRGPRLWLGLDDGARHAGPGLGRRAAAPWPWARPPFRPGGGLRQRAVPGVAPGGWRRAEPEPPREPARQRRDRELLLDAGAGTALRPTLRHTRRGALGAVRLYRGVLQPPAAPFDVGLPQPGGVRGANFNRGGVHRSGVSSVAFGVGPGLLVEVGEDVTEQGAGDLGGLLLEGAA